MNPRAIVRYAPYLYLTKSNDNNYSLFILAEIGNHDSLVAASPFGQINSHRWRQYKFEVQSSQQSTSYALSEKAEPITIGIVNEIGVEVIILQGQQEYKMKIEYEDADDYYTEVNANNQKILNAPYMYLQESTQINNYQPNVLLPSKRHINFEISKIVTPFGFCVVDLNFDGGENSTINHHDFEANKFNILDIDSRGCFYVEKLEHNSPIINDPKRRTTVRNRNADTFLPKNE
ncbi:MAG: hypothetical protein R2788_25155 [Saprospiraceae bacterium]